MEWNETTLGTLGDFMVVVPSDVLDAIPNTTWTKVVDVLAEETFYHADVHMKGDEPVPFYKVNAYLNYMISFYCFQKLIFCNWACTFNC